MNASSPMYTPGPWMVRGADETDDGQPGPSYAMGIDPATDTSAGGWPYFIRRDVAFAPGETPLHIAHGIQGLADATIIAAAPDMLNALHKIERLLNSCAAAGDARSIEACRIACAAIRKAGQRAG